MTYMTRWERRGMERGIEQGMEQGMEQGVLSEAREAVLDNLEVRFGAVPQSLRDCILALGNPDLLRSLRRSAATAESLEAFEEALTTASSSSSH